MAEAKASIVKSLQEVKKCSGKTYNQIAEETGLTNVYVGQLLKRQAQLKPETAPKLKAALPQLGNELVQEMMTPPLRSFDPSIIQDPTIYRLNEAVMHFGESIKEIVNEEFGDGIMSAIDFFCSVDKIKGHDGKERVVVTFDGKYLPHTENKIMAEVKAVIVKSLLEVKKSSGKPYNQIAVETGLTNVYCLYPLTDSSSASKTLYNVSIILFRLNEAMMHFGESIKDIVNEEFGDGIMSAIDFYCSVDKIKGYDGKEQISAHMLSRTGH